MGDGPLRCPCDGRFLAEAWRYDHPPAGETHFSFSGAGYKRSVERCGLCSHFVSRHDFGAELYAGSYVDATYGDGLAAAYARVMALAPEQSDNTARVARVVEFARDRLPENATVLDVGSGLCVFLARLKEHGFRGTALDPDQRAADHARNAVGVEAVCGDFMLLDDVGEFDLVAFNKVLEHVEDPVGMLARAHDFLADDGLIYLEVPDGEAAAEEGPEREEFFVEHMHVFSTASLALTAARAGFRTIHIERLREPSTKYTLAAFLRAYSDAR